MESNAYIYGLKQYIEKMPSLPTSVAKVLEICNNPRTSPADLNKVISLDPVLMGKVMKLINSAYYGLSQEITSLVRAIIMLGINTVKNLALSTAVLSNLGKKENFNSLNMEGFWKHSLCVGVTSKLIARKRNIDQKIHEEYFIAGLLHDIGKIPLNNKFSEEFVISMSESDREQKALYKAEKNVFGLSHSDVGGMIIDAWKLSAGVNDSVTYHHNPEIYTGKLKDIVFTVTAANFFANYFEVGFSGDRFPEKVQPAIFQHLGITMDDLEEIEKTVTGEIDKASIFLKLV